MHIYKYGGCFLNMMNLVISISSVQFEDRKSLSHPNLTIWFWLFPAGQEDPSICDCTWCWSRFGCLWHFCSAIGSGWASTVAEWHDTRPNGRPNPHDLSHDQWHQVFAATTSIVNIVFFNQVPTKKPHILFCWGSGMFRPDINIVLICIKWYKNALISINNYNMQYTEGRCSYSLSTSKTSKQLGSLHTTLGFWISLEWIWNWSGDPGHVQIHTHKSTPRVVTWTLVVSTWRNSRGSYRRRES